MSFSALASMLNELCWHSRRMAGMAKVGWHIAAVTPEEIVVEARTGVVPMTEQRLTNIGKSIARYSGPLPVRLVCGEVTVPFPAPEGKRSPSDLACWRAVRRVWNAAMGIEDPSAPDGPSTWRPMSQPPSATQSDHPHDRLLQRLTQSIDEERDRVWALDACAGRIDIQVLAHPRWSNGNAIQAGFLRAHDLSFVLEFMPKHPTIRVATCDSVVGWVSVDYPKWRRRRAESSLNFMDIHVRRTRERDIGGLWKECAAIGWERGLIAHPAPEPDLV